MFLSAKISRLLLITLLFLPSFQSNADQDRTTASALLVQIVSYLAKQGHKSLLSFENYHWHEVNAAARWSPRAGLQVVKLGRKFFLMGGRTPNNSTIPGDSVIWGDVWVSQDKGISWDQVVGSNDQEHWPARAYFKAVTKGRYIYVLGGQNFNLAPCPNDVPTCQEQMPSSDFFNDVWRSKNGKEWQLMTANAPWQGRAGLSAVVMRNRIFVIAGSKNDDTAIVGPNGPARKYFNDVWSSRDGKEWKQLTDNAPWEPRAGAVALTKDGYIYLLGGENGFLCQPQPSCKPPYFNDVWRSRNGKNWELVTADAAWSARPGHQCATLYHHIVCFGGFGLPQNPQDIWVSRHGLHWRKVSDSPWNSLSPSEIKYDFAVLVDKQGYWGQTQAIYTFGGDRETFDFSDPANYLRVDNDVWRYASEHFR
ncbi:hypothetical protein EZV61_18960 [Corallincola luteus]|uniref:Galactose oxidase n=1 Tax=Corallincola luteus TaxID=1775177 RepID=A0ABY2AFH7_9GAMM|nr:hypothetical protein [Corallincola luteus]TCI01169.1 hypothetical protein EZV61_18960 [Corallincola luteus]